MLIARYCVENHRCCLHFVPVHRQTPAIHVNMTMNCCSSTLTHSKRDVVRHTLYFDLSVLAPNSTAPCHSYCGRLQMFQGNHPLNQPQCLSQRWFPVWGSGKGWPQNGDINMRSTQEKKKNNMSPHSPACSAEEHSNLVGHNRGLRVVKVRMRGWGKKETKVQRRGGEETGSSFSKAFLRWRDSLYHAHSL